MEHERVARRGAVDGNEAAARIAYLASELIALYPITPSSPMGEHADAWASSGKRNIYGDLPRIVEMQSEAGAVGALHGALQAGTIATTFTSSQGLLLMLPNMYKIAGELTPAVIHVAARAIATHALSIFGDHSDVMAARTTGWAELCSSSVQEAQDFALVAHAATLRSRIPFLHFFDGFRTSHELNTIALLDEEQVAAMLPSTLAEAHRSRGMRAEAPTLRGSAQNPDVFFQAREAGNPYYTALPEIVQGCFEQIAGLCGRHYHLFDYYGAADAERVIVMMGSGAGAAEEAVAKLAAAGEKVGLVVVRLYRPFESKALLEALPESVKALAVLDRCKEPGAEGEPLFKDVACALAEAGKLPPFLIGGRYGLGSKEFTPAMALQIFEELASSAPKRRFTVGITDDVSHLSLAPDKQLWQEPDSRRRAVFYGLGSDGTVSANKNSAKIIASTGRHAQGYFVYDSRKAGQITVSHLRFGDELISSSYLIEQAQFVACHQFPILRQTDVLERAAEGAVFLLNSRYGADEVWAKLPRPLQEQLIAKKIRFWVVDGYRIAEEAGLGKRINTVLQTCFFALAEVMPLDQALTEIKAAVRKSYSKAGPEVVAQNEAAVDAAVSGLQQVKVPDEATAPVLRSQRLALLARHQAQAPLLQMLLAGRGEQLPVSALPVDGQFATGTSRYEKRTAAEELPLWDPEICIDCAKCALVCPHGALRFKLLDPDALDSAPDGFQSKSWRSRDYEGKLLSIQVAPDGCTGCSLCVSACPAFSKSDPSHRALEMAPRGEHGERERAAFEYLLELPDLERAAVKHDLKGSQLLPPLFEFSSACAGCGETPYLKLISQLYGDRMLVANATGCSSIYGGNLPTTPWCADQAGRGPAWANSLFEDNAEFGLGIRLALEQRRARAVRLLGELRLSLGFDASAVEELLLAEQRDETQLALQRARIAALRAKLAGCGDPRATELALLAESFLRPSVWIVGGDGWAYDIGFGGLDHVLASGENVNILVLDTQVYSNTGGQASKATPRGAIARFAAQGKTLARKDLGLYAIGYGSVYVAQVALGAKDAQTVKALEEAESYEGPSLVIAYSPCVEHGFEMAEALEHEKMAVESGYWPLYRFDPRKQQPLQLDSKPPTLALGEFEFSEGRFARLKRQNPEAAAELLAAAEGDVLARWAQLERLARD